MKEEHVVEGFRFASEKEYKLALKEFETIQYIERKIDMSNNSMVLSIYTKLLNDKSFSTIVGRCYMKNLYDYIIANEIGSEDDIPMITIEDEKITKIEEIVAQTQAKKETAEKERIIKENKRIKEQNNKYKIVTAILAAVIVALFFIVLNSDSVNYLNTKNALIDKYSAWEEDLKEREAAIREKENEYGKSSKDYISTEDSNE